MNENREKNSENNGSKEEGGGGEGRNGGNGGDGGTGEGGARGGRGEEIEHPLQISCSSYSQQPPIYGGFVYPADPPPQYDDDDNNDDDRQQLQLQQLQHIGAIPSFHQNSLLPLLPNYDAVQTSVFTRLPVYPSTQRTTDREGAGGAGGAEGREAGSGVTVGGEEEVVTHRAERPIVIPNSFSRESLNSLTFGPHLVLSCCVFCCCGWILGAAAFIVAVIAQNMASSGDNESAHRLGKLSLAVSMAGIVVGTILSIIVFVTSCIQEGCYKNKL